MEQRNTTLEDLEINFTEFLKKKFKNKTVLVTGHAGFMGTWLSLWLHALGAQVIGYSIEQPNDHSIFNAISLENKITHVNGDVNDFSKINNCFRTYNPEFIFHLAAQPLVQESYIKPVETFQTNIMGTANLLESIRNSQSVTSCIVVTSDKCYENREIDYAYKENDPLGGYDPYSASKGAAELVTASYRNSFFNSHGIDKHKVSISSVRAGNIIGGGDWAKHRIVPDCIRSLIKKQKIPVRNPNAIRPWQYVLEPIFGMLLLMSKMTKEPEKFAQAWNFGPNISKNKVTVKELVSKIISEWGEGEWYDASKETSNLPHEANFLMLDSNKAKKLLGWLPVYTITETIVETSAWHREYVNKNSNMYEFSVNQINKYIQKAKHMNISWAHSSV